MTTLTIENIRIDPEIGDGVSFTVDIQGVAHRFFVSRETLGELEHSMLADNHGMVATFERQDVKIRHAIANTLKFGISPHITFLKASFFD